MKGDRSPLDSLNKHSNILLWHNNWNKKEKKKKGNQKNLYAKGKLSWRLRKEMYEYGQTWAVQLFIIHPFRVIISLSQQSWAKFSLTQGMGWQNNNVRKQILKAFFPKSIREILIINHVNVVFGKKLIRYSLMTSIFGLLVTYVQNSAQLLNRKSKNPFTIQPGLHNAC